MSSLCSAVFIVSSQCFDNLTDSLCSLSSSQGESVKYFLDNLDKLGTPVSMWLSEVSSLMFFLDVIFIIFMLSINVNLMWMLLAFKDFLSIPFSLFFFNTDFRVNSAECL